MAVARDPASLTEYYSLPPMPTHLFMTAKGIEKRFPTLWATIISPDDEKDFERINAAGGEKMLDSLGHRLLPSHAAPTAEGTVDIIAAGDPIIGDGVDPHIIFRTVQNTEAEMLASLQYFIAGAGEEILELLRHQFDVESTEIFELGRFTAVHGLRHPEARHCLVLAVALAVERIKAKGGKVLIATMRPELARPMMGIFNGYNKSEEDPRGTTVIAPVKGSDGIQVEINKENPHFQELFSMVPYYCGNERDIDQLVRTIWKEYQGLDPQIREISDFEDAHVSEKTAYLQQVLFSHPEIFARFLREIKPVPQLFIASIDTLDAAIDTLLTKFFDDFGGLPKPYLEIVK